MKSSFHFGSFLFGDETFIPVKKVSNKENSDFGFDNSSKYLITSMNKHNILKPWCQCN